jgi:hypothetical protein
MVPIPEIPFVVLHTYVDKLRQANDEVVIHALCAELWMGSQPIAMTQPQHTFGLPLRTVKVSLSNLQMDLNFKVEPGEKSTDKVNVIDVKPSFLAQIMPTGKELSLLAHGREQVQNDIKHQRAVVIANRLPASPPPGKSKKRNIAHLVMLENRYQYTQDADKHTWCFPPVDQNSSEIVRLICLKIWQFNCTADEPTLRGRLLSKAFTFELFCVPETDNSDNCEQIRLMSYAALPYHLRRGDRAHNLHHSPLVAATSTYNLGSEVPVSADGLVRLLQNERIFDVSLAVAWQLGQTLMLRDQSMAMEYFSWRRHYAQLRARQGDWEADGHLYLGDSTEIGLTTMPKNVQDWFQKRLELRGLLFEYLIPDARILPENSLWIFRIHKTWMDCLLSGVLAVGRGGEGDRVLEAEYRLMVYPEAARTRSGFLLRSPAVDEHPDLKVGAEKTTLEGTTLEVSEVRLERIEPRLLLGLYAGTFTKLQFSLPPIGLHFGFKEEADGFAKDVKSEQDGKEINDGSVKVTLRGERVVNISVLRNGVSDKLKNNHLPGDLTLGSFAFQMCEGTERVEFEVAPSREA